MLAGLIPGNVSSDLRNGAGNPTYDAYNSTSPALWETSNSHFCCKEWSMGCLTKSMHGVFDPIQKSSPSMVASSSKNGVYLHGWAWDESAGLGGQVPVDVQITIKDGHTSSNMRVLANVSRPDVVHTWGTAGLAPNAEHGFLTFVPLPLLDTSGEAGHAVVQYTIQVHAISAATGTVWELQSSPRCVCARLEPCACV